MVIGFKQVFQWGEQTFFWQKIIASVPVDQQNPTSSPGNMFSSYQPKIHTMRNGERFKEGTVLHMATGVRTKQYHQFNKNIPFLEKVKSVQRLDVAFIDKDHLSIYIDRRLMYCKNGNHLYECEPFWLDYFAKNDGFTDAEQFLKGLKTIYPKGIRSGQLIHWTELKY